MSKYFRIKRIIRIIAYDYKLDDIKIKTRTQIDQEYSKICFCMLRKLAFKRVLQ
jgi:hypothetical protein